MQTNLRTALPADVFARYQKMAQFAQDFPGLIDMVRLNKALAICLDPTAAEEDADLYDPQTNTCGCADNLHRDNPNRKAANGQHYEGPCKHILFRNLMGR